jgi:SOS-response transcriptional repressor LexA
MGYIKEYSKEGLVSHNPAYPLMRFSGDEEVRCIGKVIGVMDGSQIADEADIELFLNK